MKRNSSISCDNLNEDELNSEAFLGHSFLLLIANFSIVLQVPRPLLRKPTSPSAFVCAFTHKHVTIPREDVSLRSTFAVFSV